MTNGSGSSIAEISSASRRIAQRSLDVAENRLELLLVEVQETLERMLQAVLLALGVAVSVLLGGVGLTAIVAIAFWNTYPLVALGILTVLYVGTGLILYQRLSKLRCEWQAFAVTLDQLRKDRECLSAFLH